MYAKSKNGTHNKKFLNKPVNTPKCNCIHKKNLPLNGNFLLRNYAVYSDNEIGQKELPNQELVKTHSKNVTQTINDHSTSIDIKTRCEAGT